MILILSLFPAFLSSHAAQSGGKKSAAAKTFTLQNAISLYKSLISSQKAYFKANGVYAQSLQTLAPGAFKGGRHSVCKNWCLVIPRQENSTLGFIFDFRNRYCHMWCGDSKVNNPECIFYKGFYYCLNAGKTSYKLDFFEINKGPYLINGNGYGEGMEFRIRCGYFDCPSLGAEQSQLGIYYIKL